MKKLSHISIECFRRIEYVKYINCRRQSGHWLLHGNSFTGKGKLPFMREKKEGRIIFTSSGVGVTGFGNISPYASSKGAIESLAKCLEIENQDYGITFHIMHPPLTNTASSSELPVPKEFMADAEKIGKGLADHVWSKKFVICHSFSQSLQMKLCYCYPLYMGKMMWKMTQRAIRR